MLWEKEAPGGVNFGLIDVVARHALDHGYHVIVEGVLVADLYGEMLSALCADHRGHTQFVYFDISFDGTLRRHATKPQASQYGAAEMRAWFRPRDLLPFVEEMIVPESSSLDESVELVIATSGLADPVSNSGVSS